MYSPLAGTETKNLPPNRQHLPFPRSDDSVGDRRSTSSRSARSIADALSASSETPMPGWPPSHAFLMKVAAEDDGNANLFPVSSPSPPRKCFSVQEKQQRMEQQRYPSWQRGPLLLDDATVGSHGQQHHRRHSSSLSAGLPTTPMPGLLTCREDNMSTLATYSEEDGSSDCHDGGGDRHRRTKSAESDKNKQPSTGRTETVSEFSNLAGLSGAAAAAGGVFPFTKASATDAKSLELVSSYSTAGYAGWSKFCLATSDGEEEEDSDGFRSFGQTKEGASEDSRTYSITSEEEDANSDETAPPLRGEQEDFGVGVCAVRSDDKEGEEEDDDDIEFTAQETQAILRVMDRLECGAATIAKYAAFSLEDWLQDVCGPIIKDLEGSESYRSSGLNARHRFGREESIPCIRRYVSAKLCPASPALLCDSLPARVRRRAFVNTAAAMRGEVEDPFSEVLGNNSGRLAVGGGGVRVLGNMGKGAGGGGGGGAGDEGVAGGGTAIHNPNNFSSVVGRRLIEHGKAHYTAAAGVGGGGRAPAGSGVRSGGAAGRSGGRSLARHRREASAAAGASSRNENTAAGVAGRAPPLTVAIGGGDSYSESESDTDSDVAGIGADFDRGKRSSSRQQRQQQQQQRQRRPARLKVDLGSVRAPRGDDRKQHAPGRRGSGQRNPVPSNSGGDSEDGGGGGVAGRSAGSRGDGDSVFQSFQDDEDYYAGDSDSCSPRSGAMLPTAKLPVGPKAAAAGGHAAGLDRLPTDQVTQRSSDAEREQRPRHDRPYATVAATLATSSTKSVRLAKQPPPKAVHGALTGRSILDEEDDDGTPPLAAPRSAMAAVEAATAAISAEVSKFGGRISGRGERLPERRYNRCPEEAAAAAAVAVAPGRITKPVMTVATATTSRRVTPMVTAKSAGRSTPPAPRPVARVARRTELAVLSPISSPRQVTSAGGRQKAADRGSSAHRGASANRGASAAEYAALAAAVAAATAPKVAVATAAATAAAAVTAAAAPRTFYPGNARGGSKHASAAAAGRQRAGGGVGVPGAGAGAPSQRKNPGSAGPRQGGREKGSKFMEMLARARESKPEYTPESDETATTGSAGRGEYGDDGHSNGSDDEQSFHDKKAPTTAVGPAERKEGGKGSKAEGKRGGGKRVFFASSAGQPLAAGGGGGDSRGGSGSGNNACAFSLSCSGGCDRDDGRATGAAPAAESIRAAAAAAAVPPPEATAPSMEEGRLLYEHVTRIGGVARPKMSPVRLVRPRRPRVVYESLW